MQNVILPFNLSKNPKTKAVSEITFSVNGKQSQFSAVYVTSLRFMKVYEQERYTLGNYPFSERWHELATSLAINRTGISQGTVAPRPDLEFGSARNPELKALDMLPQWIELELVRGSRREDRTNLALSAQAEYQSTDTEKTYLREDNAKIQSIMILNTNLIHSELGAFEGTISCDMRNLGSFNVREQGHGNTFTIRASMYNFMNQALSEMPMIQVGLLFR